MIRGTRSKQVCFLKVTLSWLRSRGTGAATVQACRCHTVRLRQQALSQVRRRPRCDNLAFLNTYRKIVVFKFLAECGPTSQSDWFSCRLAELAALLCGSDVRVMHRVLSSTDRRTNCWDAGHVQSSQSTIMKLPAVITTTVTMHTIRWLPCRKLYDNQTASARSRRILNTVALRRESKKQDTKLLPITPQMLTDF